MSSIARPCRDLGAHRLAVWLVLAAGVGACAEDDAGRDGEILAPQARAEQALYAEIAQALHDGAGPLPQGADAGEDPGGEDSSGPGGDGDPADGGATDGGADAGGSDGGGDGSQDGGATTSCVGACGGQSGDCWCDDACASNGDCCADYGSACAGSSSAGADDGQGDAGAGDGGGMSSCAGACGDVSTDGCWCDDACSDNGDCCDDYAQVCGAGIAAGPASALAIAPPSQDVSLSCLASWTATGAVTFGATGVLVGEALSKSCEVGGVIVGVYTAGAGFAAATVCLAGDVTQADAALGGIVFGVLGALKGLVDGIQECDDEQLAEAEQALGAVLESRGHTERVFVAPIAAGKSAAGTCNPCPPVPSDAEAPEPDRIDCVPPSIPHGECTSHHVHVYGWKTEQNPQDCVCRYKADETYLCYDPVNDPDFASNPIWDQCL